MQLGLHDILTKLHDSHSLIDDILRQHREPRHRAPLLANMYRTALPGVPLHACLLRETDQVFGWVLDETGTHHPEWVEQLQQELNHPNGSTERELITLDTQKVAVEDIRFHNQTHGLLGLGLPENGNGEIRIAVRTLLALCARQLALYLQLEQEERERQSCESDREGLTWLANIGELASPMGHEVNNFLNATLLHVAVLSMQAPEQWRSDLAEIRRQGTQMAGVVKQLQQYRRRHQPPLQSVDLNRALREVVADLSQKPSESGAGFPLHLRLTPLSDAAEPPDPLTVHVTLDLAPQLPAVLGLPADLKRLCSFLITNAAGAVSAAGGGAVTIRTEATESAVVLRLSDTGSAPSPDQLAHFFEPGFGNREGTDSLELTACRNLVRRCQGNIRVELEPEQGMSVFVELPVPQSTGVAAIGP